MYGVTYGWYVFGSDISEAFVELKFVQINVCHIWTHASSLSTVHAGAIDSNRDCKD